MAKIKKCSILIDFASLQFSIHFLFKQSYIVHLLQQQVIIIVVIIINCLSY